MELMSRKAIKKKIKKDLISYHLRNFIDWISYIWLPVVCILACMFLVCCFCIHLISVSPDPPFNLPYWAKILSGILGTPIAICIISFPFLVIISIIIAIKNKVKEHNKYINEAIDDYIKKNDVYEEIE